MAILAILFAVLGFLIFPSNVYAEFTFNTSQITITQDQEIDTSVTISLQGQNNKIYYLEGAFKKEGSSNYFGLTWNDSSWVPYTASNFATLKPITTNQVGEWNGIVKVKIDKENNLFSGDGIYTLRLKRFTTGGSYYWAENSISITVNSSPSPIPTSSPSSTPTPTPISTSTPSPTPKSTSSFTISGIPPQINSNQSFEISVDLILPNNKNTDYYLSGAFKKVDGARYFGFTKINSSWVQYSSSNYLNQYKITTDNNGNWAGTLEVKPDTEDSDYKGAGDYTFKVARYSSNSNPSWSNESTINIAAAISTPQASSTLSPSSLSPIPSNSNSLIPPRSLNPSSRPVKIATVAGAVTHATYSATPSSQISIKNQKQTNPIVWIGLFFIFAGIGSIGYIYLKSNGKIPFKFRR